MKNTYQPLSYGLKNDPNHLGWTIAEATLFDDANLPISWAIRKNGMALSKATGEFNYEPLPSSRDEIYLAEHRFKTVEEAISCWETFN